MEVMRWIESLTRALRPGASGSWRAYEQMRQIVLDLAREEHRANLAPVGQNLLAVLVEMTAAKNHRTTLACVADGTTSLYLSSGGGVIGASEIPTVRVLALELLEIAAGASRLDQDRWARVRKRSRDTRFDFVTTDGVVTGWGDMAHPMEESAFLRLVYVCAQKVITEIRVSQPTKATPTDR